MKLRRSIVGIFATILCALFVSTGSPAQAQILERGDRNDRDEQSCLPGISAAVRRNPVYVPLYALLEVNHSAAQRSYVDWKYQQLAELVATPPSSEPAMKAGWRTAS